MTTPPDRPNVNDPRTSGILRRFRDHLPLTGRTPLLSLHEGDTPLVHAPRLAEWVGVRELFLKYEGLNPTGSFKDRGMVLAVARAVEDGARAVLCASTGNTAASAAAYAAHAGVRAIVLLPAGRVAAGKFAQAVVYGARVVTVDGSFDDALELARAAAECFDIALVNSVNPARIEGQTTSAYEICDVLGDAPSLLALPVGNGGNITAYWLGFRRAIEHGRARRLPRMLGVQAEGAAPFLTGVPIVSPETIATAIRIGRPATWEPAIAATRESGGGFRAVSDAAILEAYRAIAEKEGIFCEPASAAGVAGMRAAVRERAVGPDQQCVCVLTGNGLKDPETAVAGIEMGVPVARSDLAAIARLI
ncbi:MAG TPA: threonine synthase [Longimicrobiales bacterium]|nr:threonine synthase [Longimicrobiales bacterium]